jgi:hypothetical protein
MGGELAETIGSGAFQCHGAIGDPDAFPVEIQFAGRRAPRGFLWTGAGKKRPVENGQLRLPGWIGNGDREEARVFVIHVVKFDTVIRTEGREPQTLPVEEVLRYSQGDPWHPGRKRRVGHYIALKRFYEGNTRILAATAAIGPALIIGFGLQRDAEPLDPCRIASLVEPHPRDADTRVIIFRDQSREEVKLTIRATRSSRIQDPFDLLRIARLRFHYHAEAV